MSEPPKAAERARREQRLGAALRENLKRRRAQAKGRGSDRAHARRSHDSAGFGEDKRER